MNPDVIVPAPLAQALVDYLQNRPWREVNALIQGLAQCPKATPQNPAAPPTRKDDGD